MVKAILTFFGCIVAGCALHSIQLTTYPVDHEVKVWLAGDAKRQVDSIARRTGELRVEQAACVSKYRVIETESGTAVHISRLDSAAQHWADSVNIFVRQRGDMLCKATQPVLHSHVVDNPMWGQPSPLDEDTAETFYPRAPFHLVLSVKDLRPAKLTVYALR